MKVMINTALTNSATISCSLLTAPSTQPLAPLIVTISLLTLFLGNETDTPPNSSAISRNTSPRRTTK